MSDPNSDDQNESSSGAGIEDSTTDRSLSSDVPEQSVTDSSEQEEEYFDMSEIIDLFSSTEDSDTTSLSPNELELPVTDGPGQLQEYKEGFSRRAATAPEVAWNYEEVDNQIRYEYPYRIYLHEEPNPTDDPQELEEDVSNLAQKKPIPTGCDFS